MPIEGGKTSGLECEEGDTKANGRNQLIGIFHDLQKLVENTSLVASRALGVSGSHSSLYLLHLEPLNTL